MKKIICLVIVATIAASLCSTAFAANVCKLVGGDLSVTESFTVKVGGNIFGNEKIVIKQSYGVAKFKNFYYGNVMHKTTYGKFYITVVDRATGEYVYKNKSWNDDQFTISSAKLKKNHSYKVTIKGVPGDGVMNYSSVQWKFISWDQYPTWKVSKTGGNISYCK